MCLCVCIRCRKMPLRSAAAMPHEMPLPRHTPDAAAVCTDLYSHTYFTMITIIIIMELIMAICSHPKFAKRSVDIIKVIIFG